MSSDDQIELMISKSISIIEIEINKISEKQDTNIIDKMDCDKIIEFLKTLILVQKDKRSSVKESIIEGNSFNTNELDLAIKAEIEKLKNK